MADQLEGARTSPVKFVDQGDGSVAERLSIAEAGAAGNSAPALATNATGLLGWLRKIVDVLTGTLSVDTSPASALEITASTYTNGYLTAYTERRRTDLKTRTWTITRNADNSISTATVTDWA